MSAFPADATEWWYLPDGARRKCSKNGSRILRSDEALNVPGQYC
jgi:hypothetical protein